MTEQDHYYPTIRPHYTPDGLSVYGEPDPLTLRLLRCIKKHGQVLEVGAGDGRYTIPMLEQGLYVIASDADQEALAALH